MPVCMCHVSRYLLTIYYQDSISVDPVVPAATGLVFHFLWYFIKNIFSDLRRDLRYGSVSKIIRVDGNKQGNLKILFYRDQRFEMVPV